LVGSQLGAFQLPVRWLRLLMAVVLAVASVKLLAEAVAAGVAARRSETQAAARAAPALPAYASGDPSRARVES
jgi:uncharacterized membrane protein YfcA